MPGARHRVLTNLGGETRTTSHLSLEMSRSHHLQAPLAGVLGQRDPLRQAHEDAQVDFSVAQIPTRPRAAPNT
jgi:hypothetical protein